MHKIVSLTLCLAVFAIACNDNNQTAVEGSNIAADNSPDTSGSSVENRSPNTSYKPAFPGQTRIGRVATKTPYEAVVITSDLKNPWGIAVLPDGRFLITQKGGTMCIVTAEGKVSEPITGLPPVNYRGQGGLLGLTLDPAFANNKMVYWVFSENVENGNLTSVAKGKLSADEKKIENATVIYRATPAHNSNLHYGGRILFDRSGNLIVSTGERSDKETRPQAQSLNSGLGKLVRITTDGKPASGNPFAGQNNARPEIYSYGHRNVQGLAWHPETGDLWENEYGPQGGDEINLIRPAKNYGWPTISYGEEYSGGKIGDGITQKEGLEQPVYYWDPVVSPSGMTFYNADLIPEWKNNLFVAALNKPHLIRLVIENNKVTGEERFLEQENQRFRDVAVGKNGALYAVTDAGRMYRIGKK
ncbi:PQQ-dependent sugar dehydrogenase [Longitalea arenae]|uniref:PQQ-dependent sugar dehydrogenase n=1 Tax=Longitalea arenae TaxID=2812558 RepID=UPI001967F2D0|nr:PQQ-dependent sugar dehydrogenase [Longitalea arenae]